MSVTTAQPTAEPGCSVAILCEVREPPALHALLITASQLDRERLYARSVNVARRICPWATFSMGKVLGTCSLYSLPYTHVKKGSGLMRRTEVRRKVARISKWSSARPAHVASVVYPDGGRWSEH